MSYILKHSLASLKSRFFSVFLTIFSITVSVALVLGVEKTRVGVKESFYSTITGTDMIVGARGGGVQLLLYTVFRIGRATNNISWDSFLHFSNHPEVEWAVPLSLGDSHRGFRVLGTTRDFFDKYKYGSGASLELSKGKLFEDTFSAVLGYEVAKRLSYDLGTEIYLTHGFHSMSHLVHDDYHFKIVGVLKPTGTPVDQTIFVSLQGIEAIHIGWGEDYTSETDFSKINYSKLQPKTITAFFVGLKSRIGIFAYQREVNDYLNEPLMAILPGVTLSELWQILSNIEKVLFFISALVVVASIISLLTMVLSSLSERKREMAILRSVGARPRFIFILLLIESTIVLLLSCLLGLGLVYLLAFLLRPFLLSEFGFNLVMTGISANDIMLLSAIVVAGILVSLIPAIMAYFRTLNDGIKLDY